MSQTLQPAAATRAEQPVSGTPGGVPVLFRSPKEALYQEIADNARAATGARVVFLLIRDPLDDGLARTVAASGFDSPAVRRALAAVRRIDPGFDPATLEIRLDSHALLAEAYRTAQPSLNPFHRTAGGLVDPRIMRAASAMLGFRYTYIVPLPVSGKVAGSLTFLLTGQPTEALRQICHAFGRQATLALENAALLADADRRASQAQHIAATLAAVGSAPDLQAALTALSRGAVAALGGQQGVVLLFDPSPNAGFWVSADGRIAEVRSVPPPGSSSASLRDGGPPRLFTDLLDDETATSEVLSHRRGRGMRSSIAVPIVAGQERIGSLHVDHREPGYFRPTDLALALALATQAGAAVERVRLQQQLESRERRFRALIERSQEAVALLDAQGLVRYVSPAVRQLFGSSPEELLGTNAFTAIHPDDVARVRQQFADLIVQPDATTSALLRRLNARNEWQWLEATATNLLHEPSVDAVVVNFRDVSERVRTEREREVRERTVGEQARLLARQAERLRLLNDFARTASGTLDLTSACTLIAQQVATLLNPLSCLVMRYDAASETLRFAAVWQQGAMRPASGGISAGGSSGSALAFRTRAPFLANDTRESPLPPVRARAQQGVLSVAAVPIVVRDAPWGVLNLGFEEANAVTHERLDFLNAIADHLAVAIHNAQLYTDLQAAHAQLQATQQQVVQQERLRALGQMASGVAHDLNNALAPVVGFSELLLTVPGALQDRERTRQYVSLIHTGAQDAAGTVRGLREFYRPRSESDLFAAVSLPQLMEQAATLTQPKWRDEALADGRTIAVTVERPADGSPAALPLVLGREAELREALTNLIFNAVDALPRGGAIALRAYPQPADDEVPGPAEPAEPTEPAEPDAEGEDQPAAGDSVAAPRRVALEVADTGVGMTEEVRARCLEPFFTTKGERGTGLGLAMVYGIVQRHGGNVEIESAAGQGTVVRLWLPAAPPDVAAPSAAQESGTPSRPLRILVVDDEAGVRDVTSALLAVDGHTVTVAGGAHEALECVRTVPFDVVVTDRAMPDMGGVELAAAVKRTRPGTPVVLLTGFGDLMAAAGEQPPDVDAVLGKPATLADLRRTLSTLIA